VFRVELASAARGDGPALWCGIALALLLDGLLAVRRLTQGGLSITSSFDVTVVMTRQLLPLTVMTVAGYRWARRRHHGVDQALDLAGVGRGSRLVVVAADATVVLVATIVAELLAVVVGSPEPWALPLHDLATLLVGTALCVGVVAILSAAVADRSRGLATYLAVGLAAALLGSLLYWAGSIYPVLDLLGQTWPWHAATSFLYALSPARWLVGAMASAGVVLLAAASLRRDPPELRETGRSAAAVGAERRRRPLRRGWAAVALVGASLAWGLAGPATLSAFVPWYLRPQWLSDEARHQSSPDVAAAWLRAVQAGDRVAADRLGVAPARRLAGPLYPWLRTQNPGTATVDRSPAGDPGVVTFTDSAEPDQPSSSTAFVCLVRRAGRWQVSGVRSRDDCPRAAR
jgi:hypothetical protein